MSLDILGSRTRNDRVSVLLAVGTSLDLGVNGRTIDGRGGTLSSRGTIGDCRTIGDGQTSEDSDSIEVRTTTSGRSKTGGDNGISHGKIVGNGAILGINGISLAVHTTNVISVERSATSTDETL